MGTGTEACGRAHGLEWVAGPWWGLDAGDSDVPGADGGPGGGAEWDGGGGVGLVYLVAGGEAREEYAERAAAWRSVLRGTVCVCVCV